MTIEAETKILGTVSTGESLPLTQNTKVRAFCLKNGEVEQWEVANDRSLASEPKELGREKVVQRSVLIEDTIDRNDLYLTDSRGKAPLMDRVMHKLHLPPIIGRKLVYKSPR